MNSIKQSTTKGVAWSMIERFSTIGIQLLCTIVIAKYITPDQFGLVSMMSVFLSFSLVMVDGGFGQAIVREQNITEIDKSSLLYFNIIIGVLIYNIFFFAAPLIAKFYTQPELTVLLRVLFLSIIINALTIVQEALLYKSVNFSRASKISLVAVIISGTLGVVMAIQFKNVWALIIQTISFSLIKTILYWLISDWHPSASFSWKSIKKYLDFSFSLLGSRLIASIADNMANLFIGKAYSSTELGNYTVPDKLQKSIAGTISFAIHRVSYSVMSTFQDDIVKLRIYSQKVVNMAFYIIAPIMTYLFIVAKDLFPIILSPQWAKSAEYFQYMCIIGALFCFADINLDVLLVKGKSKQVLCLEIIRKTILVASLSIAVFYNIKTLLLVMVFYNILNTILISYYAGRIIEYGLVKQLLNTAPIIVLLVISAIITVLALSFISNSYVYICVAFVIFFVVYYLGSVIFKIPYLDYVLSFIRKSIYGNLKELYSIKKK